MGMEDLSIDITYDPCFTDDLGYTVGKFKMFEFFIYV
jgi:hypothetical protein